jgi:hypothetical protein
MGVAVLCAGRALCNCGVFFPKPSRIPTHDRQFLTPEQVTVPMEHQQTPAASFITNSSAHLCLLRIFWNRMASGLVCAPAQIDPANYPYSIPLLTPSCLMVWKTGQISSYQP